MSKYLLYNYKYYSLNEILKYKSCKCTNAKPSKVKNEDQFICMNCKNEVGQNNNLTFSLQNPSETI